MITTTGHARHCSYFPRGGDQIKSPRMYAASGAPWISFSDQMWPGPDCTASSSAVLKSRRSDRPQSLVGICLCGATIKTNTSFMVTSRQLRRSRWDRRPNKSNQPGQHRGLLRRNDDVQTTQVGRRPGGRDRTVTPAAAPLPTRRNQGSAASEEPISGLRFMVPNTAGSGYDTTARAAAKVMDDVRSPRASRSSIWPAPAAPSGCPARSSEKGNGKLMMMMGLGVVGAPVHQQVRSQAGPDHPDRQADRGVRGHRGSQGLPVQDDHGPGRRPGRPTQGHGGRRRLLAGRARTTCCRCSSPRPWASTPRR